MAVALTIPFSELRNAVSFRLGYGRKAPARDVELGMSVDAVVRQGLREFYYNSSHEWSFLKPPFDLRAWASASGTLLSVSPERKEIARLIASSAVFYPTMTSHFFAFDTKNSVSDALEEYRIDEVVSPNADPTDQSSTTCLVSDLSRDNASIFNEKGTDTFKVATDGNFDLPVDFYSMNGLLTYGPNEGWLAIGRGPEETIRRLRMANTGAGKPVVSAVRPKVFDSLLGQRSELMLHPKPDGNYTLSANYTILPEAALEFSDPDGEDHFPLGGMAHAETILMSCLAKAEFESDQQRGDYSQEYEKRLQASIRADLQTAPASLGHGHGVYPEGDDRHLSTGYYVDYNGVRAT